LAEWLYEDGIGENRAALIRDGEIIEAQVELPDELRAGAVLAGRLTSILVPKRRAIVSLGSGKEALLEPLPGKLTEGAALRVEVVREALPERGRRKLPKVRVSEAVEAPGPELLDRLGASGIPVTRIGAHDPDRLEEHGWSQLLEEAATGEIGFEGGALRMSLTPAMTLFDVDGPLEPRELAVAGAAAAGRAISRLGIGGSIGIDLPTLPAKEDRQAAASALDAALPQPFERTAVNGFGFLQVVRRRERASIAELVQGDPVAASARSLIRAAQRSGGGGERTIYAAPPVVAYLGVHADWLQRLERHVGAAVRLREEPGLAISAGHVHSQFQ
jgi:hypothetical protein